jgi:hypothetical protein
MPAPVASGWSVRRVGLAPTGKAPPCHGAHGNPVIVDGKPKMICKEKAPCISNEYDNVSVWVTHQIKADVNSLPAKSEDQKTELQTNGTRFRGFTSQPLTSKDTDTCSYGFWYQKLQKHIKTTIEDLKVSEDVKAQLHKNYTVKKVEGPHEQVMKHDSLEDALKD